MVPDSAKPAAQLLQEREQRISDAIALRVTDRVPVMLNFGFFPAKYYGIDCETVMYDGSKADAAWTKTLTDFQPDAYDNPFANRVGGMLAELSGFRMMKWPGHGVDPHHSFQYLDLENMKASEYDEFLNDMGDFMIRKYWPRVFGSFEAFKTLPPLSSIMSHVAFNSFAALNTPEIDAAFATLDKLRKQAAINLAGATAYTSRMQSLGFPPMYGPIVYTPFDLISNNFRSTRGAMLDMYRHPDKLIAATEKMLPIMLDRAISGAASLGCKRIFIPLHKGQEYFMSLEQYKKFYWPGFRKLMIGLIDAGLTPCPLVEGEYTSRLEIIADVPPGKVCYLFEKVDFARAKAILGKIACIRGGVPVTLMCTGTPDQVREACQYAFDAAGKDGGFILEASAALDDARPENIKALIDFAKERAVYS